MISYYPSAPGTQVFSENFDGVTAPGLPSGWTTSASGAQSAWVTQTSTNDTPPNAAYSTDATNVAQPVVSPAIALPVGQAQLSFRNNYDLETGAGTDVTMAACWKSRSATNSFTDILAAGGSFLSGGYNSVIDVATAIR